MFEIFTWNPRKNNAQQMRVRLNNSSIIQENLYKIIICKVLVIIESAIIYVNFAYIVYIKQI